MGVEGDAGLVQPGVRLAVVGVILPRAVGSVVCGRADQADLVAVVDGRRAGQGELQDGHAAQALEGVVPVVVGISVERLVVLIGTVVEHEEGAAGIMAAQQVHHGVEGFGRVALHQVEQALVELRGHQRLDDARAAARVVVVVNERLVAPEAQHGRAELVVHRGVPLIAQQPGGGVAPFLADDVAFRVGGAHGHAEAFPIVIVGVGGCAGVNIPAHIQAPAIGVPGFHPVHGDWVARARPDEVAHFLVGRIQLGQAVEAKPACVGSAAGCAVAADAGAGAGWHVGEVVPVAVFTVLALASAYRSVIAIAVEVDAVRRGVVEDAIQHDVHAASVGFLDKQLEQRQVAKVIVNDAVIGSIVLVVGWRLKDRVEVDGSDAQVFEVIQLVQHTLQVAAVEVLAPDEVARTARVARVADRLVPVRLVGAEDAAALIVERRAGRGVIGGVAIAEAVGEDLVEDGVLDPIGGGVVWIVDGKLPGVILGFIEGLAPAAGAAGIIFVVIGIAAVNGNEAVPIDGGVGAGRQGHFPPIIGCIAGREVQVVDVLHIQAVVPDAHPGSREVVAGGAQAQRHRGASDHRAAGGAVERIAAVVAQLAPPDVVIVGGAAFAGPAGRSLNDGDLVRGVELLGRGIIPVLGLVIGGHSVVDAFAASPLRSEELQVDRVAGRHANIAKRDCQAQALAVAPGHFGAGHVGLAAAANATPIHTRARIEVRAIPDAQLGPAIICRAEDITADHVIWQDLGGGDDGGCAEILVGGGVSPSDGIGPRVIVAAARLGIYGHAQLAHRQGGIIVGHWDIHVQRVVRGPDMQGGHIGPPDGVHIARAR